MRWSEPPLSDLLRLMQSRSKLTPEHQQYLNDRLQDSIEQLLTACEALQRAEQELDQVLLQHRRATLPSEPDYLSKATETPQSKTEAAPSHEAD